MRITLLGTCGGTEPVRGFRHTSIAVENNKKIFFFDAGEGCSHTAHLLGIDLPMTRAVFISHCHMDHIGGLGNLLWNIRKLEQVSASDAPPSKGKEIKVVIPDKNSWEGILKMLEGTEGGFKTNFTVGMSLPGEGEIFNEDGFKVSAAANGHMDPDEGGRPLSFSYKIESGGKSVVFSGDVKLPGEIKPLLDECSLLLMETGHHSVEDVCSYIKDEAPGVKNLLFIHHGREILASADTELKKAKKILGDRVFIGQDKMAFEV